MDFSIHSRAGKKILPMLFIFLSFSFKILGQHQLKESYIGNMLGTTLLFLNLNDSTANFFFMDDTSLLSCSKEKFIVKKNRIIFNDIGTYKIRRNSLKIISKEKDYQKKNNMFKYDKKLIQYYSQDLVNYSTSIKQLKNIYVCTNSIVLQK